MLNTFMRQMDLKTDTPMGSGWPQADEFQVSASTNPGDPPLFDRVKRCLQKSNPGTGKNNHSGRQSSVRRASGVRP